MYRVDSKLAPLIIGRKRAVRKRGPPSMLRSYGGSRELNFLFLRVCRQIHHEAQALPFRDATIAICVTVLRQKQLFGFTPAQLSGITKLRIVVQLKTGKSAWAPVFDLQREDRTLAHMLPSVNHVVLVMTKRHRLLYSVKDKLLEERRCAVVKSGWVADTKITFEKWAE
jgi:hypothetical protein